MPESTTPESRIPVTVLTGFLGAGKTSLLNRLLRDPAFAGTAVIINEFGSVGLDHLLVETAEGGVTLLAAGCLCCTVRGDLVDALTRLAGQRAGGAVPRFVRVVIETTGLADPAPILQTLIAHPALAETYALDGIITLVDAVNGMATLDAHAEAVKQAAVADRLVLTKTDLAGDTAPLRRRLAALNPAAPILDAQALDAADLLGLGLFDPSAKSEAVRGWLRAEAHAMAHEHGTHEAHGHHHHGGHGSHGHGHHAHHHDVNRHDERIRAFALASDRAIPPGRFETFLDLVRARHGEALLRFKALVKLADDPARPVVVHGVQHVLHPPLRLTAWPDGDRTSRLVFIVRDLDPAVVEDLFAAFLGEPRLDRPDAAALADNPLALR